ncbi:G-type lectin S-receptor-like serine/threonine-protein kinase [Dorcoceras hygrometricum]|uniref:G-type lectin S-receptor-like serine/threonine-protein kinase n=1 Tax=Dorcoceras hygrometricum TaxID=472368 RepID=A0A2Z7C3C2_9LAMI|nr:G-type lectin S-receptor-like serine/threonine-protein kinase [Dorcoceras hygrometricum]
MQIDSDLVIYRTTLVRTFQVVTICRVDKSEVLVVLALSVIPRGSWGDVARRFTMIRWASPELRFRSRNGCGPTASCIPELLRVTQLLHLHTSIIPLSSVLLAVPVLLI